MMISHTHTYTAACLAFTPCRVLCFDCCMVKCARSLRHTNTRSRTRTYSFACSSSACRGVCCRAWITCLESSSLLSADARMRRFTCTLFTTLQAVVGYPVGSSEFINAGGLRRLFPSIQRDEEMHELGLWSVIAGAVQLALLLASPFRQCL